MKNYLKLSALALTMVLTVSCGKDPVEQPEQKSGVFTGEITVVGGNVDMTTNPPSVGDFVMEGLQVTATVQEDGTYQLLFQDVTFSNMMPTTINMIVPDVKISEGKVYLNGGAQFVNPLMKTPLGTEVADNYKISALQGTMSYKDNHFDVLEVSFTVTRVTERGDVSYPTSYHGVYVTE